MINKRYQGKIVRWNDDRGFGFIQTNGIKKDIFLHISSIQGSSRRPKVGDTIYFGLKREADGKYKAENASFTKTAAVPANKVTPKQDAPRRNTKSSTRGTSYQRASNSRRSSFRSNNATASKLLNSILIGGIIIGVGVTVPKFFQSQSGQTVTSNQSSSSQSQTPTPAEQPSQQADSQPMQNCNIKGNISYPDGQKFYHKPGSRDYDKVEIFENEGERWFCSEQEAINAGFKDAANQ